MIPPKLAAWSRLLVVGNYYLAATLLLIAGILKLLNPEVSELLQTLYEQKILGFDTILVVSRRLPWLEILVGGIALSGWNFRWLARIMALLYLIFTVFITYASQGYLLLPIDCGCFGTGEGTPAYLLILRNTIITLLLLFGVAPMKSDTSSLQNNI
ncbi:MAG: hypothetical protein OEY01_06510 [Desulfobulbaceae bacterium]|nr:hypothetical protein [Desulfobulbaceae bacterium]HIJ78761.1 hypothetical protein [Deltaproteobacteria bacterium]